MIKNTVIQQKKQESPQQQHIQQESPKQEEEQPVNQQNLKKINLFNFATNDAFGFELSKEQSDDKSISTTLTDQQQQLSIQSPIQQSPQVKETPQNKTTQNIIFSVQPNKQNNQSTKPTIRGLILPKNLNSQVKSSQTIFQQNMFQETQTMIAQEPPQPAKALPVLQMQTSEMELESTKSQLTQQQQQIQYQDTEDLTFQDLQVDNQQSLDTETTKSEITQSSPVQIQEQQIYQRQQPKKQKQNKDVKIQQKEFKQKKSSKKHKHHRDESDSDYNPSESDQYSSEDSEDYDYYQRQPKKQQQQQKQPLIIHGTRFNQQIQRDQDGIQDIRFIKNVDDPKPLDLKIQKVEIIQKQKQQNVKSQQTSVQSRRQSNDYQSQPQNQQIKQQRVESIPDPVNDVIDYNYNEDNYDYAQIDDQQDQQQNSQVSRRSQSLDSLNLSETKKDIVKKMVEVLSNDKQQQGQKPKALRKQHKNKKQQNKVEDDQTYYSDDEIMSPGLIDEYNNLTDTLVQPQKFVPDMYATLQIEQEQQKEQEDEVVTELLKCATGNRQVLEQRKHANLSSSKIELIEIGVDSNKLPSKRLSLEPLLGEKWIWANGKKIGIKLAFEVEKQGRKRFTQAWNIRHQNHIQKISEDETGKSIIYNKDGKKEEIIPVLRFENYKFQQLDKGVLTASLSQSGENIQQIVEIEPQTNLSKQLCQGETSIFVASGNCQLRIYGDENTQQTFYLRTYDTCLVPQDCEFEIQNDKNVICI